MGTERYLRHNMIDWFDQQKLKAASVIVVGAGAIGNEVLKNLCLLGLGKIHIVDFDVVEEHNLTRTILCSEKDIDKKKAEAVADACAKIDSNCALSFSTRDFWDSLSIREIKKADAVLCCVDNYEARIKLNQLCLIAGKDFYNAAIDSRQVIVEVYPYSKEDSCACYECALPGAVYDNIGKRYSCGWLRKVSLEEKKVPTTTITASLAGAFLSSLFLQRLCRHPQALKGAVKFYCDTVTFNTTVSGISRNASCPACAVFGRDIKYFSAKRRGLSGEVGALLEQDKTIDIIFSEPFVFQIECKICGHKSELFESAYHLNEAVSFCSTCNASSNAVDIKEQMCFNDFAGVFLGKKIPVKFIRFLLNGMHFVVEMED